MKPEPHVQDDCADLLAMVIWLRARALDRLTHRQADFTKNAICQLTEGRGLTPKQDKWLRDLHARHASTEAGHD